MTDAPPSRYRIVEQDRKLVVIDQWNDKAAPPRPAPSRTPSLAAPRRTKFDGSAELVTNRLYDLNAPRTIALDPGAALLVSRLRHALMIAAVLYGVLAIWKPWLIVIVPLLLQPRVRKAVRARITAWLDRQQG